jgi:lipopolysaccharide transport system permease protein
MSLITHRYLLAPLIKRDVLLRHRGAMFGVAWVFLNLLIMLAIFAYVFGQIFQARWPQQGTGAPFWFVLYGGMIAFKIFAEPISCTLSSVRGNSSQVTKIIVPVGISST